MNWLFRRRKPATLERTQTVPSAPAAATSTTAAGSRPYIFGESEAEISRLDMQHYMFRWEFGSDSSAPGKTPASVLDVACGTGRLARDLARQFPQSVVIGFDINQGQIEESLNEGSRRGTDYLPENCTFLTGDALQRFNFQDSSFDLAMARATSAFIPVSKWPQVVTEMARVCRTAGWVELRDFGLVRSPHPALNELTVKFANMAAARGIYPGAGPYLGDFLQAAGLRSINMQRVTVRSGGPQKATRGGRLMLADYLALLQRVTPVVAQAGIDSAERWEQLINSARSDTALYPDQCYAEVELTAAFGQR
jgi:ubiquinone/menaquinone biosynthesis C-methylase UbiE